MRHHLHDRRLSVVDDGCRLAPVTVVPVAIVPAATYVPKLTVITVRLSVPPPLTTWRVIRLLVHGRPQGNENRGSLRQRDAIHHAHGSRRPDGRNRERRSKRRRSVSTSGERERVANIRHGTRERQARTDRRRCRGNRLNSTAANVRWESRGDRVEQLDGSPDLALLLDVGWTNDSQRSIGDWSFGLFTLRGQRRRIRR